MGRAEKGLLVQDQLALGRLNGQRSFSWIEAGRLSWRPLSSAAMAAQRRPMVPSEFGRCNALRQHGRPVAAPAMNSQGRVGRTDPGGTPALRSSINLICGCPDASFIWSEDRLSVQPGERLPRTH
jgi:hypothetical protein